MYNICNPQTTQKSSYSQSILKKVRLKSWARSPCLVGTNWDSKAGLLTPAHLEEPPFMVVPSTDDVLAHLALFTARKGTG